MNNTLIIIIGGMVLLLCIATIDIIQSYRKAKRKRLTPLPPWPTPPPLPKGDQRVIIGHYAIDGDCGAPGGPDYKSREAEIREVIRQVKQEDAKKAQKEMEQALAESKQAWDEIEESQRAMQEMADADTKQQKLEEEARKYERIMAEIEAVERQQRKDGYNKN